ncbi:hypothetical protein O7614_26550 [Micromonospora sp. WMMD961]|nr:hypothetical protein [Micromonospora sp. WMMD961]MDG4783225.1 hypothetical protein [Micromonospora sp. WMMD961]
MKLKFWDEIKAYRAFEDDALHEFAHGDEPEFIGGKAIEAIEQFFGVRHQ